MVADRYRQRVEKLDADIAQGHLQSQKLGVARIAVALPGIVMIAANFFEPRIPSGIWQFGTLLLIGFLALATWHENLRDRIEWWIQQRAFYRRLLARCDRTWTELPPLPSEPAATSLTSDLSRDLDLFGDRSLFRWASLAVTDSGAATLGQWMMQWVPTTEVLRRQTSVRELAELHPWRQSFWDAAIGFRGMDSSPEKIAQWGAEPPLFQSRSLVKFATWVGPCLAILGLIGGLVGILASLPILFNVGLVLFLVGIAINLLLTITIMGSVHDVFVRVGTANRELQSLSTLFSLVEELQPKSELLNEIRSDLIGHPTSSTQAIGQLRRTMSFAGIQRNPLFFIPYWILQLILLWDIRVLERLEGWKKEFGNQIARWIQGLGTIEALNSAATIADENPDWAYPTWFDNRNRTLQIQTLGHPLLKDSSRVCNDVSIDRSHPLLLVTGSNMAGKSTLLRSLGINTILARTGSPVACRAWNGPNLEVASSIRVQDSLQDGVSFFMAELKRLRSIVDFTETQLDQHGRSTLVLLDEILQGTNSRERQIAVEQVLGQLIALEAIVVASTHDLDLAKSASLVDIAQVVHFREFFETRDGTEVMRFDYVMRPGVTPTTNALKLLELVGLANRRSSKSSSSDSKSSS
ncbi:MAG: hypothetical protein WCI02_06585 [Planctomycetota bacterium]